MIDEATQVSFSCSQDYLTSASKKIRKTSQQYVSPIGLAEQGEFFEFG
jgi:hypothetical protein